ncbi:protein kinase [Gimesia benthica]|uniref:non-specific serine/threonine protein kinase n=1 Tax=Gimesia benthica TaxID=2608982 RepID=A0A6I6ACC3_9PLAN|nr:serine/threonine-protein kinase [Gimesia benthica]QGQ23656.1 protein kinase [Gimesia benthica]
MTSPEENQNYAPGLNKQLRINAVCEQFEDEWNHGSPPEIKKYLDDSERSDRSELLFELLSIDSHWRWIKKQKLSQAEYELLLADDLDMIQEFFNKRASSFQAGIQQISDTSLLSLEEMQLILKSIPVTNRPTTVQELIEVLIQHNKLTAYQARQISEGTIKGLVLGDYLVLDVIGAGGMGQVYLAEHRRMNRRVALKTLPDAIAQDSQSVLRFEREVRAAAKLLHPNIVTAHDAGESDNLHYLVMEWVDGIDLSKHVKQHGKLPVAQAVNYVLQAAKALEYAHGEGIIHRDIKPANLILDEKGTIKILDMGLARMDSTDAGKTRTDLTSTGMVMGTIDYMAPEQALDSKLADARSDIYSLGCLLHYLLTGKVIYDGDTILKKIFAHRETIAPSLTATHPDIPVSLDTVFQKMVAKDPEDRQQSMSQVIHELEACGCVESPSHHKLSSDAGSDASSDKLFDGQQAGEVFDATHKSPNHFVAGDQNTQFGSVAGEIIQGTNNSETAEQQKLSFRKRMILTSLICLVGISGLSWSAGVFSPVGQKTEKNENVTTAHTPQRIPQSLTDPQKRLAEFGIQNEVTDVFWTSNENIFFGPGSELKQLPQERIAVCQIMIDWNQIKSNFEWKALGRVSSLEKLVSNTPVPVAILEQLKGIRRLHLSKAQLSDREILSISKYPDLHTFTLYSNLDVTDVACDSLAKIASLRELDINATGIAGEGLKKLTVLPNLYFLSIGLGKGISIEDLNSLQLFKSLKSLSLHNAPYDQELVKKLGKLNSLRSLHLNSPDWSETEIARLQELLPDCSIIHSSSPAYVADQKVAQWVVDNKGTFSLHGSSYQKFRHLPKEKSFSLESIDVVGTDGMNLNSTELNQLRSLESLVLMKMKSSDDGLAKISDLSTLRYLVLSYSDVSFSGLEKIKRLKQLEGLHLKACWNVSDNALQHLSGLTQLTSLVLGQTPLTDLGLKHVGQVLGLQELLLDSCKEISSAGIGHLVSLPRLRFLDLNETQIDDSAISHLKKMKGLRVLKIYNTKITADGAKRLQSALPECVVFHESLEHVPWTGLPEYKSEN